MQTSRRTSRVASWLVAVARPQSHYADDVTEDVIKPSIEAATKYLHEHAPVADHMTPVLVVPWACIKQCTHRGVLLTSEESRGGLRLFLCVEPLRSLGTVQSSDMGTPRLTATSSPSTSDVLLLLPVRVFLPVLV